MEYLQNINMLDAVLGGILLISTLIGLTRGLVVEILSLTGWIVSLYVANRFAPQLQPVIGKVFDSETVSYLLAFVALFIGSLFVLGLVNLFVGYLLARARLTWFNAIFGAVFGAGRGIVICALILFIIVYATRFGSSAWYQESKLAPSFKPLLEWSHRQLPDSVRDYLNKVNPDNTPAQPAQPTQAAPAHLVPGQQPAQGNAAVLQGPAVLNGNGNAEPKYPNALQPTNPAPEANAPPLQLQLESEQPVLAN